MNRSKSKEMKKQNLVKRFSFRMTEEEATAFEKAAEKLSWKPSDLARVAVSAAVIAAEEKTAA